MNQLILWLVAAVALTAGTSTLAATYTYTGNAFTVAVGSYTTAMSISGEFTTALPLDPNLVAQDITGLVQTFTFSDGVNTITDADGTLAAVAMIPGLTVSTDGSGDIIAWSIFVRDLPLATAINETNDFISTINTGMIGQQDQAAADAPCNGVDGVPNCTGYGLGTPGTGINFNTPGTWVTTLPPPGPTVSEPIPGLTGYSLALTGLGLLLLGMRRLRR